MLGFLWGCVPDGIETLVLPEKFVAQNINDVIPVDLQEELLTYMPIYEGELPPNIAGTYLFDPFTTLYTSDGNYDPGYVIDEFVISFENKDAVNVVSYRGRHVNASAREASRKVTVQGSGDNFTAFFLTLGESQSIRTETAVVLSGTKTLGGISNIYYAFVMIDKGLDLKGEVMREREFRIFYDGDNFAENHYWPSSINIDDSSGNILHADEVIVKTKDQIVK